MKSRYTLSMAALLSCSMLAVSGCSKLFKVEKSFEGGSVTFIVDPQAAGNYSALGTRKLGMDELLKTYGLKLKNLKSLRLEKCELEIIDSTASPVTFDIVDAAELYVAGGSVPMTRAAHKDPVPHTGLTVISPDINTELNWVELAKADEVQFDCRGVLNAPLTHPIKMKATLYWRAEGGM